MSGRRDRTVRWQQLGQGGMMLCKASAQRCQELLEEDAAVVEIRQGKVGRGREQEVGASGECTKYR